MSEENCSEVELEGRVGVRARNPTAASLTSLQKISGAITGSMETFFYRWGLLVATHPWKFILTCLLVTTLCSLGIVNFRMESRPDRLWIARESEFAQNTQWLRHNFPAPVRTSWALITAPNILHPSVMKALYGSHEYPTSLTLMDIHDKVRDIKVDGGKSWDDICVKLPITNFMFGRRRRKRSVNVDISSDQNEDDLFFGSSFDGFDDLFSDDFFQEGAYEPQGLSGTYYQVPDGFYCTMLKSLDEACWEGSPAELWSFNSSLVNKLTQEQIIWDFNHQLTSPIFGRKVNYSAELGGHIEENELGEVVGAQAVLLRWSVRINQSVVEQGKAAADGAGDIVDNVVLQWEQIWTDLMHNISKSLPKDIHIYYVNSQSWMAISEATLFEDGLILAVGFIIMFFYVGTMLGKFNLVEQRPFLTMAGLSCVGLACLVSYGICSVFKIVYGPVNKILPFLLLGIGIDDMFIIVQCWNNLFPNPLDPKGNSSKLSIAERMAMAMKHAGVSITVTSLTDVAAFLVGASTILPGLQSFCIYAAVGIVAIFIFQATYFVAWFSIDQRRVEDRRNAFFPWIKYKEEEFIPNKFSQQSQAQWICEKYIAPLLFNTPAKVAVIVVTSVFLGFGIYGNTQLRQEFDPMWFLPNDSYMSQYVNEKALHYPSIGYPAYMVASEVNWTESLPAFNAFVEDFKNSGAIHIFENWFEDFKDYVRFNFEKDIPHDKLSEKQFRKYLGKFLFSPAGAKFKAQFKFDENFDCGESVSRIQSVIMPFRFRKFHGPEEHIPALAKINALTHNANLTFTGLGTPKLFPWGTGLVAWETDRIINNELYRNVALSLCCVLITTFLLLANFRVCFFCALCVIFTLVNVGGWMHFWGLTIDTVTTIDIVLGIGLCVDYAAHIGLAFMTCAGERTDRAKRALKGIGPAVLNGGFSTFLAIILLASSKSHAFQSFFKIFTVVIFFGLYHGLIFLPVLLSMLGPEPYPFALHREIPNPLGEKSPTTKPPVEMQPLKCKPPEGELTFGPSFEQEWMARGRAEDPLVCDSEAKHI